MTLKEFLPREHGAWAMWIVPILSAAIVTRFSALCYLFFLSFALLFVAHHPIVLIVKRRKLSEWRELWQVGVLAIPAFLLGLTLVLFAGRVWLILFGAVELALFAVSVKNFLDREQRSFINELGIVAALTLTAPAAYYVVSGELDATAAELFLMNFLFFGSSVFYVKMRIEFLKEKGKWEGKARTALVMTIIYHFFLLAILMSATAVGVFNPWLLAGFVPVLAQVIVGTLSGKKKMSFTRLGVALVFQSAVFLGVMGVFFR